MIIQVYLQKQVSICIINDTVASITLYISNISKSGSKSSRLAIIVAPLAVCSGYISFH